jgi:uncharacterized membrane protein
MTSEGSRPDLESSIWIGRPPEEVWNYVVDVSNDTQWRTGVTEAQWDSGPPYGVGSTGIHTAEGIDVMTWRIAEWEEPRIMSWDVTGGRFKGGHAGYRIEAEVDGSRMTLHVRVPRGILMRILLLFMKGRIRRDLAKDLAKLKVILEG